MYMPEGKRGGLPTLLEKYEGHAMRTELLVLVQNTLAETKAKVDTMMAERVEKAQAEAAMQPPKPGEASESPTTTKTTTKTKTKTRTKAKTKTKTKKRNSQAA